MEVSDRAVYEARAVASRLLARARERLWAALALAGAIVAAVTIVAAQPVHSPWWTYADADAPYMAAGLNLLLGVPVRYLDHPGLPLEEVIAVSFGAGRLIEKATADESSRTDYVDGLMLDLDRARPVYRSLAIAFYLAGAILSFLLLARLFGHWTWGLAAGLLWLAAPGLAAMSIQYRPDVPLAVLVLVFGYLVGRAMERRSTGLYAAAAAVAGLAVMVKMHAGGLLVPLALAALWRHPEPGWPQRLKEDLAGVVRRRRRALAALALAWLAVAVLLNKDRVPFSPTRAQAAAVLGPAFLVGGYLVAGLLAARLARSRLARRLFDPFYALVAAAFLAGMALPATLALPEGFQSFVNVWEGLSGGGINDEIPLFATPLDQLGDFPLRQALVVFVLAGAAAALGLARRDPLPVVWFSGALVLAVMAQARLAAVHYFAPALVLSVPAALWLLRQERGKAASLLVWPVIAYAVVPQLQHRDGPRLDAEKFERTAAPSLELVERRLRPGEVALTPSYWPSPDTRYFELVQLHVNYTPEYPYSFLPASSAAARVAAERGWRLRYYTGREAADVTGTQTIPIGDIGVFKVRRLSGAEMVVELLDGPGT